MGEGLDLPEDIRNTPIRCLGPSTRRLLSCYLDPPAVMLTPEGLAPDITGLADLAGFDSVFIRYLETKPNKTVTLLDSWGTRNNATIGNLVDFLKRLERFDIIHDVREFFVNDVTKWIQRSKADAKKEFASLQSDSRFDDLSSSDYIDTEDISLTVDDIEQGSPQRYTACICCSENDLDLARLIVDRYSNGQSNFRFFIPQEQLLGGRYEFETTAEVIESRCDGRLIVIISRSYFTSPACNFATQFVKTLDPDSKRRKIIPIVREENVIFPRVLRGITAIKAFRLQNSGTFWRLLTSSLSIVPISHSTPHENPVSSQTLISSQSTSLSVESEEQLQVIRPFDMISKNITDEEDDSNISRDSMSLRSGSFDSASDLGECEKIINSGGNPECACSVGELQNEFYSRSLAESRNTKSFQRARSVPDFIDLSENENEGTSGSDTDSSRSRTSSLSQTQKPDGKKKRAKLKSNKSPRQWLLNKLFKSLNTGSKGFGDESNSARPPMNSQEKHVEPYLRRRTESECCTLTTSKVSSAHAIEDRTKCKTSRPDCGERPITVPIAQKTQHTHDEKLSPRVTAARENPRIKLPERSRTEEVSRRQYFTLDL